MAPTEAIRDDVLEARALARQTKINQLLDTPTVQLDTGGRGFDQPVDQIELDKLPCEMLMGLHIELEMIKLGVDPENEEERLQFYSQRRALNDVHQTDAEGKYGSHSTDIVVPVFEIDFETKIPRKSGLIRIWRKKELGERVLQKDGSSKVKFVLK